MAKRRWSEQQIMQAIDDWVFIHGALPSTTDWRRATGTFPTAQTVGERFGTFKQALQRYSEEYKPELGGAADKNGLPQRWDEESVIAAFQTWAEAHDGFPPATLDAQRKAGARRVLPSPGVVEKLFGSWNKGLQAAGFAPLPQGVTYAAIRRYRPIPRSRG